MIIVAIICAS